MQKYLENIYKILFENNFENVQENTSALIAVCTIFWTSLFLFVSKFNFGMNKHSLILFVSSLFGYLISIYLFWLISSIFYEFIAKIFGKSGKMRKLLMLSSYCLLPYIFFAPLELMKKFSETGYFLGTKLEILLFFWVIILYASVLENTYDIKKSSSFMLIFLPSIAFIFGIVWIIGSIFNLGYIYSV